MFNRHQLSRLLAAKISPKTLLVVVLLVLVGQVIGAQEETSASQTAATRRPETGSTSSSPNTSSATSALPPTTATTTTSSLSTESATPKIRPPKEKKHKKPKSNANVSGNNAAPSSLSTASPTTTTVPTPATIVATGATTTIGSLLNSADCEYEKGAWEECGPNGIQTRKLKLKLEAGGNMADSLSRRQAAKSGCELVKIVRRECQLGCKYARGDWSPSCTADGLRVRVDTLIGKVAVGGLPIANGTETLAGDNLAAPLNCPAQRRVTKDCRRACHYIKSAWSECTDGFRTRNLTLDESPPLPLPAQAIDDRAGGQLSASCAKLKQIKRECRNPAARPRVGRPKLRGATTTTTTTTTSTTTVAPPPQIISQVASSTTTPSPTTSSTSAAPKLTASQRRRQKLKEIQQRQQQQRSSQPASTTPADGNQPLASKRRR